MLLNSFVIGRTMVLMPKWDAGEALRLIERGEDHLFRRRADDEPRTDAASGPRQIRSLLADRHRRRRRAAARSRTSSGWRRRSRARSRRSATASPRPTRSAAAISGPTITTSPPRPAGRTGRSSSWRSWARATPTCPPASAARSRSAPPPTSAAIGATRRRPQAAFTADGYLKTGDIGYLDEDDYLFIVDRKKDIIIRGGENISAQEVEAAIYAHPLVSEASVFGVADERLGEVPAAVVYCEAGRLDKDALCAFLAGRLAQFKLPAHVWFVAEPLPKLGTGKIDKVSLREHYRNAGRAAGVTARQPERPLVHCCRWAEETDDENIRRQRRPRRDPGARRLRRYDAGQRSGNPRSGSPTRAATG